MSNILKFPVRLACIAWSIGLPVIKVQADINCTSVSPPSASRACRQFFEDYPGWNEQLFDEVYLFENILENCPVSFTWPSPCVARNSMIIFSRPVYTLESALCLEFKGYLALVGIQENGRPAARLQASDSRLLHWDAMIWVYPVRHLVIRNLVLKRPQTLRSVYAYWHILMLNAFRSPGNSSAVFDHVEFEGNPGYEMIHATLVSSLTVRDCLFINKEQKVSDVYHPVYISYSDSAEITDSYFEASKSSNLLIARGVQQLSLNHTWFDLSSANAMIDDTGIGMEEEFSDGPCCTGQPSAEVRINGLTLVPPEAGLPEGWVPVRLYGHCEPLRNITFQIENSSFNTSAIHIDPEVPVAETRGNDSYLMVLFNHTHETPAPVTPAISATLSETVFTPVITPSGEPRKEVDIELNAGMTADIATESALTVIAGLMVGYTIVLTGVSVHCAITHSPGTCLIQRVLMAGNCFCLKAGSSGRYPSGENTPLLPKN